MCEENVVVVTVSDKIKSVGTEKSEKIDGIVGNNEKKEGKDDIEEKNDEKKGNNLIVENANTTTDDILLSDIRNILISTLHSDLNNETNRTNDSVDFLLIEEEKNNKDENNNGKLIDGKGKSGKNKGKNVVLDRNIPQEASSLILGSEGVSNSKISNSNSKSGSGSLNLKNVPGSLKSKESSLRERFESNGMFRFVFNGTDSAGELEAGDKNNSGKKSKNKNLGNCFRIFSCFFQKKTENRTDSV